MPSDDADWHQGTRYRNRIGIKADDAIEIAEKFDNW